MSTTSLSVASLPKFTFGALKPNTSIGVGTWSWGDKSTWKYDDSQEKAVKAAFDASVDNGVTFLDTAEVYGDGKSEELIGKFVKERQETNADFASQLVIATKFMPLVFYFSASNLRTRFELSCKRLGVKTVDLYQIHGMAMSLRSVETWMDELAKLHKEGRIKAIGVSNFTKNQVERAHAQLKKHNIPLASNQIEFSLLRRRPEHNGVLDVCKKLGVTVIAYSPLAMGRLCGKYDKNNPPPDNRKFGQVPLDKLDKLTTVLRELASRYDKTPSQISLNWCIMKGTFPISGARNAKQAAENAGAQSFQLSEQDIQLLDDASKDCQAEPSWIVRQWQD